MARSANAHFHFHLVVLDGAFSQGPDGEVRFHEASHLESHHWVELQRDRLQRASGTLQRRVLRYFRRQGLLDEADADGMLG